jgi:WD40 repeat protein
MCRGISGVVYFIQWDHGAFDRLWLCSDGALSLLDVCGAHPLASAALSTASVDGPAALKTLSFHSVTCCGVAVAPDGRSVVAGDFGGNLMAWRVADARRAVRRVGDDADALHWGAHSQPAQSVSLGHPVRSVCWAPDGRYVVVRGWQVFVFGSLWLGLSRTRRCMVQAGCETGQVMVWDREAAPRPLINLPDADSVGSITCLKWRPQGGASVRDIIFGRSDSHALLIACRPHCCFHLARARPAAAAKGRRCHRGRDRVAGHDARGARARRRERAGPAFRLTAQVCRGVVAGLEP